MTKKIKVKNNSGAPLRLVLCRATLSLRCCAPLLAVASFPSLKRLAGVALDAQKAAFLPLFLFLFFRTLLIVDLNYIRFKNTFRYAIPL